MPLKTGPAPSTEPLYRIGAVARATGIAPDTLRVWERRYQGMAPSRSQRGGRLYTDADIARLRVIKQLLDRGHAIGRLADLAADELHGILARHPAADPVGRTGDEWNAVREAFVDAISGDRNGDAQRIIGRAALLLDAGDLVLHIVAPTLKEVGDRWADGRLRIAHEHAASGIIRSVLGALLATQPIPEQAPVLIAATPSAELHELGALQVAVLAGADGWRVSYLGPNMPAAEIVAAAARVHADAVALSIVSPESDRAVDETVRIIAELPAHTLLIAGGSYAQKVPGLAQRAHIFQTLAELPDWLTQQRRRLREKAAAPDQRR